VGETDMLDFVYVVGSLVTIVMGLIAFKAWLAHRTPITITLPSVNETVASGWVQMSGRHNSPTGKIFWTVTYSNTRGFWPKEPVALDANGTWVSEVHCGDGRKPINLHVVQVSPLMNEVFQDIVARGRVTNYWEPTNLHPPRKHLRFVASVSVTIAEAPPRRERGAPRI
jgi:hypothetical protein